MNNQPNSDNRSLTLYLSTDIMKMAPEACTINRLVNKYIKDFHAIGIEAEISIEVKHLFKKRFFANGGTGQLKQYGGIVESAISHLPIRGLSYGCPEECIRVATFDWMKECVIAANSCGVHKFVAHMNFDFDTDRIPGWLRRAIEWWQHFLDATDSRNIFYLENMLEPTTEPFDRFFNAIGSDRVKMCMDVGHLNCTGQNFLDWIHDLHQQINHYHLSDNPGHIPGVPFHRLDQHLGLGLGSINWGNFLNAAKSFTPSASFCLEVASEDLERSVEFFLELFK